jgi:Protein of unknown function DUF262
VEAHARSPRDLFEGKPHYEIPLFQRPYVWNEEDQWAPLWDDVTRVAESYVGAKEAGILPLVPHHFLGAIVYESMPPVVGPPLSKGNGNDSSCGPRRPIGPRSLRSWGTKMDR